MRRRKGGIGGILRGNRILAEGTELAVTPVLDCGELHTVRVACDAPPSRRMVRREFDAASLREYPRGLHAEGTRIDIGGDVEGD